MGDMWSKIKGFPNYSVSDDGKVRNDRRGKPKALNKRPDGYLGVDLYGNGHRTTAKVHRLVGDAFLPNPDGLPQINHKDGNKYNNSVDNLEWVSAEDNMKHAVKNGLWHPSYGMLGKENPNAGRPGIRVRIIETGEEFQSITDCAEAINGNDRHICDCLSGRQRTHRGYHFEYA